MANRSAIPVKQLFRTIAINIIAAALSTSALSASRSVVVNFHNETDSTLTLTSSGFSASGYGEWVTKPPQIVRAHASAKWKSQSSKTLKGVGGSVTYMMSGHGSVRLAWDNPFVGSNSYDFTTPDGFTVKQSAGKGNDATVDMTLEAGGAFHVTAFNVDKVLQPGDFMFKYVANLKKPGHGLVGLFTAAIDVTQRAFKAGSKEWNEFVESEHLNFHKALAKGDPNCVHMGIYVGGGKIAEANGTSMSDAAVAHWDLFKDHKNEVWFIFRSKDKNFASQVATVANAWANGRMKYLIPAEAVITNAWFGPKAKGKALTYAEAYGVAGGPPSVSRMFCSEFAVAVSQCAASKIYSDQAKKKMTLDQLDKLPIQVKLDSFASPATVYGVFDQSGAFEIQGPIHVG